MLDNYTEFHNANGTNKSPALFAPDICFLSAEEHDILLAGDLALNQAEQLAKSSNTIGETRLDIISQIARSEFEKSGIKESDVTRIADKIKSRTDEWYSIVLAGYEKKTVIYGLQTHEEEPKVLPGKSLSSYKKMKAAKTLQEAADALQALHLVLHEDELINGEELYLEFEEYGAAEYILSTLIPEVDLEPVDKSVLDMGPIANAVFGYRHPFGQSIPINTVGKNGGIVSVVLDMDKMEDSVKLSAELSLTDKRVYNAVITALANGHRYFSPRLIYKIASGNNPQADPSPKALKEIEKSIDGLIRTLVTIDLTKQNEARPHRRIMLRGTPSMIVEDHLIAARKAKYKTCGQEVTGYVFHHGHESILYDYAKAGSYLFTVPTKAFDSVGQMAIEASSEDGHTGTRRSGGLNEMVTQQHILELIHLHREKKEQRFNLTYANIFSYMYPGRDTKSVKAHQSRDAKKIFRMLDAFQREGLIIGYEEYTPKQAPKDPRGRKAAAGVCIILSEQPQIQTALKTGKK